MVMNKENIGLCNKCKDHVPCEFILRDGGVWLRKDCPKCGPTESLVSNDAAAWQKKRDLWKYIDDDHDSCAMHCGTCNKDHKPRMIFIDVTNRCNMNCPICIATIKTMGFEFTPPLAYFDKVFADIAKMDPKPVLMFFGGEPTVREDLLELIDLARKYGLRPHVVTNGLRLADEEYCRKLCEARVLFRFGFDGLDPEIYQKLRHNRPAGLKKLKALENLQKYSHRKHTLISCFAKGINDKDMPDYLQYCHDHRDVISDIGLIPLTENWDEGEFNISERTTMEDVEKMVSQSVNGGNVEFIPAGLTQVMWQPRSFFRSSPRSEVLLLGGVHPNCESITLLVSDGKGWRSINHYLKKSFTQLLVDFARIGKKIAPKLDKLDPKKRLERLRGQLICIIAFAPCFLTTIRFGRTMGILLNAIARLFSGSRRHHGRYPRRILRLAMLPFEEQHSIDAKRLENCKAAFAYEDTDDGKVKYIPACLWYPYRDPILKKLSEKYGVVKNNSRTNATPSEQPTPIESSHLNVPGSDACAAQEQNQR